MFKKIVSGLIDRPLFTSLFIADFAVVLSPLVTHIAFSLLLVGALVVMSMYLGQKLALFND